MVGVVMILYMIGDMWDRDRVGVKIFIYILLGVLVGDGGGIKYLIKFFWLLMILF